ncbi:MAG: ABC transporter permease subunit [Spirochaetales bacterium]|nr:ABC transporter permease subunit [Spirochaetales bacterium]
MKIKILLLLLLIIIFLTPVLVLLIQTLSSRWVWPQLIPDKISLRALNYMVHESSSLIKNLGSSFLYSMATVIFSFIITILPASVIARTEFTGKSILETLFLLPVLVPSITFAMGVHFLFIYLNLTDTFLGVVLVLTTFTYPYMLRALIAGYNVIGSKYSTAAENLGAGKLNILLGIELPLILPSAIAGGSIVFLAAFSEYFLVFLIGGGAVASYSGYLFPFLLSTDRQTAALLSLIFLIIPIFLFFILDTTLLKYYRNRGMS